MAVADPQHLMLLMLVSVAFVAHATADKAITKAPEIIYQFETAEHAYKSGDDVEMKCQANAESNAVYQWKKDGAPLDLNSPNIVRLPDRGGSFLIKNPNVTDNGVYQCFASNDFGTAVSIRTALRLAEIESFPTVTDAHVHRPVVGSSLSLQCRPPRSYPTGNIYWGISRQGSNQLKAVDNDARVVLSYDG